MTITAEELKAAFKEEFKDAGPAYNHFDSFKAGVEFAHTRSALTQPADLAEQVQALIDASKGGHRHSAFPILDSGTKLLELAPAIVSELARLRQDEKRYTWLKTAAGRWWDNEGFAAQTVGQLDAAIDAQLEGK